ncbi:sensor histidine kinase [Massilia glaciei]|uniref:Sensor histidine kinase n=1 Tax=Massilia glaciei TaxID=1524097 RepID=A0A2U2HLZ7_9BURK|nr:histidine kinase [Massilia glaciei]PWF48544.1 sensor histidine kinase [Massilia glaciei]
MDNSAPQAPSSHPLDLIPLFRRWPASPARDLLYTGLWNCLIALFLAAANAFFARRGAPFSAYLLPMLLISNIVGYLIHASLLALNALLGGWPGRARGAPRVLYQVGVVGLCVVAGIAIGSALLKGVSPLAYLRAGTHFAPLFGFALFAAAFMFLVFLAGERRISGEILAARQSEQIAAAAQLLAEARLRALQAQIEPHFLYNTLANVVSLIDSRPKEARHMLERFIDYLRASLAASRADRSTVGAELTLAGAYLDVLAVRMGARLRYRIEAGPGCRELAIAPMLLQPIIENAVAHGLEPKIEGGEIVVRAHLRGALLCIEVSDTGVGLGNAPSKPGGGVGLGNLRARLRSLYGGAAQVQLLENEPGGVTVRVLLPLQESPPSTIHAP